MFSFKLHFRSTDVESYGPQLIAISRLLNNLKFNYVLFDQYFTKNLFEEYLEWTVHGTEAQLTMLLLQCDALLIDKRDLTSELTAV